MSDSIIAHIVAQLERKAVDLDWYVIACGLLDTRTLVTPKGAVPLTPEQTLRVSGALRPWLGITPTNHTLTR
jgi:hypothetical protein